MQHLAGKIPSERRRVDFVTQHRIAKMMQMHPNLMCAATVQCAFDQTGPHARTRTAIFSFGRQTEGSAPGHSLSVHRMSSDFVLDYARLFPQFSSDQREVNLFYCAGSELFRQFPMRHVVFCYDEAAACCFIETVNDAGPFLSTDARQRGGVV